MNFCWDNFKIEIEGYLKLFHTKDNVIMNGLLLISLNYLHSSQKSNNCCVQGSSLFTPKCLLSMNPLHPHQIHHHK